MSWKDAEESNETPTGDTCDGCGAEGRYYEGLCYQCKCDGHAAGWFDMDGDGRVIG